MALAVLAGLLTYVSPLGGAIDRSIAPLRFGVINRAASGDLVIVEMDARSAAAIKRWPWSRTHYAGLVDNLRRAGASSIVFDVDFSSPSDQAGDAQFAGALARAEGLVVLPTFAQVASADDQRSIDALPIPALREHAALASVSVSPDPDGQVRSMPFGTITAGTPRPSLSAYIAHRSGEAGAEFPIDMSIDPATIPRLSFIDVRNGQFDHALVHGRDVLVGATAIEMGDRYGTPRWGVIPGVIVQALAAETLLRGVPHAYSPLLGLFLAMAAVFAVVRTRGKVALAVSAVGGLVALVGLALSAQHGLYVLLPLAPGLVTLFVAVAACGAREVLDHVRQQRVVDDATGLPNRRAFIGDLALSTDFGVAAARIADYDKLSAALGANGIATLVQRVRDRISVLGSGVTVYRVGDRVLAWCATVEASQVPARAEQLRAIMLSPVEVDGRKVDVSLAIGFAKGIIGQPATAIANAVLATDLAMTSGAHWHIHEEHDASSADAEISLISELEQAMERGDVTVVYQPKLDLRTNRVASAEALVRWSHPTRGAIRPDYFIPLVEKADRIDRLTLFVLRRAISDLKSWDRGSGDVRVAVNLSAVLFESNQFIRDLRTLLRSEDVDPTSLTFEVTESAAMRKPERAIDALNAFKALGIAISVDDYGTGQSTLSYLKKLPLDELKIDRSFVEFAHQNRGDAVLVRSTVDLAHELGLKVVAEGVETAECLDFLRSVGCDLAQGYLISRPVDSAALQAMLVTPPDLSAAA